LILWFIRKSCNQLIFLCLLSFEVKFFNANAVFLQTMMLKLICYIMFKMRRTGDAV